MTLVDKTKTIHVLVCNLCAMEFKQDDPDLEKRLKRHIQYHAPTTPTTSKNRITGECKFIGEFRCPKCAGITYMENWAGVCDFEPQYYISCIKCPWYDGPY